jgi:hypothetical protein
MQYHQVVQSGPNLIPSPDSDFSHHQNYFSQDSCHIEIVDNIDFPLVHHLHLALNVPSFAFSQNYAEE